MSNKQDARDENVIVNEIGGGVNSTLLLATNFYRTELNLRKYCHVCDTSQYGVNVYSSNPFDCPRMCTQCNRVRESLGIQTLDLSTSLAWEIANRMRLIINIIGVDIPDTIYYKAGEYYKNNYKPPGIEACRQKIKELWLAIDALSDTVDAHEEDHPKLAGMANYAASISFNLLMLITHRR